MVCPDGQKFMNRTDDTDPMGTQIFADMNFEKD